MSSASAHTRFMRSSNTTELVHPPHTHLTESPELSIHEGYFTRLGSWRVPHLLHLEENNVLISASERKVDTHHLAGRSLVWTCEGFIAAKLCLWGQAVPVVTGGAAAAAVAAVVWWWCWREGAAAGGAAPPQPGVIWQGRGREPAA